MGRTAVKFAVVVVLLTAVWCAWNESLSLSTVTMGLILSALALVATNRFLLRAPYQEVFSIRPLTAARYVVVLIVEIFKSGVHAIHVTLTGRINVGVVNIPTSITNPLHGVLVANAITLTPGTVTIDYTPGNFKVIWIECSTDDPDEASRRIKASFERVFAGRDGADA
ncbi:MAG: hypothetical protein EA382_02800 [Spirochaetaceae bacterium]|nr:MAG: hypothetical protein EA382_02800 [Spirochaetaceae bacterium]